MTLCICVCVAVEYASFSKLSTSFGLLPWPDLANPLRELAGFLVASLAAVHVRGAIEP